MKTSALSVRAALLSVAALAMFGGCGADTQTADTSTRLTRTIDAAMNDVARMELTERPELATRLGLAGRFVPVSAHARLNDRSQAGFERRRLLRIEALARLENMPLAPAGSPLRREQQAIVLAYRDMADLLAHGHGRVDPAHARPFAIDHLTGAWIDVPDLLITRQPVTSRSEALAYLSRLSALGDSVQDERRRLIADAEAGIVPPLAILDRLSDRLQATQSREAGTSHPLVLAFENLLTGAQDVTPQEASQMLAQARLYVDEEIEPAYRALAGTVTEMKSNAGDSPGVWALPRGDAYYDKLLALYTYRGVTPEQLHAQGLSHVARLTKALDEALAQAGLIEGSVAERLALLSQREDQTFVGAEDGRAELFAALNAHAQLAERRVMALIAGYEPRAMTIAAVPGPLERQTGGAIYRSPAADGSRPGTLYISLGDLSAWPRYTLASLVHHELVPGHHVESGFAMSRRNRSMLQQLIWPVGYGEGWATYAERLAADSGMIETPLDRVGFLRSQLMRAARLVADTGMHRLQWSRKETVDYLAAVTGLPIAEIEAEVDRLTVWPGQGASYMAGADYIEDLRQRAQGVLGERFDLAAFHNTLLLGGPRPLERVEADLERWYQAQLPAAR